MTIITNFRPENLSTLGGVLNEVLKNYLLDFEFCTPAIVQSYDRVKNVVIVLPAMKMVNINGESKERLPIEIPVLNLCGGKIFVNFPLELGDTGWIIGGDRNTENFLKNLETSEPSNNELFKYNFGFFIPDKITGTTITEADAGYMVITTLDGNTKISIKDGEVKVKTLKIIIDSPSTVISGNVTVNGSIGASGNISSGATVTGSSNVIGGGKSLNSHLHQVVSVGAPTGAPL